MTFPIFSERLILRMFRMSDLDTFQAYRSDPLVAQFQGWQSPYPRANAHAYITELLGRRKLVSTEWLQIAIERKADQCMIGDCAFHLLADDPRQAEMGYSLARSYWGQGYASEAVTALLGFLFDEVGLHRVTARCDVLNTASARLLERVGMRCEGHFIENVLFKGAYSSEYAYAMLMREWEERHETV